MFTKKCSTWQGMHIAPFLPDCHIQHLQHDCNMTIFPELFAFFWFKFLLGLKFLWALGVSVWYLGIGVFNPCHRSAWTKMYQVCRRSLGAWGSWLAWATLRESPQNDDIFGYRFMIRRNLWYTTSPLMKTAKIKKHMLFSCNCQHFFWVLCPKASYCRQQLVFCFLFRKGWHIIGVVTHFPSTFLVGQIQNISMHLKILNWNRVQTLLGDLLRQLEAVFLLDTGWYLVDKREMFSFDSEDLLLHVARVFRFLGCEMPGSLPEDLRSWRDMCLA